MPTPRRMHRTYPAKSELSSWMYLLQDAEWMDPVSLLDMHKALHKTFGEDPSDAVLEGEQMLSKAMRSLGLEHRYKDALSKAAGTLVDKPAAPTLEEMTAYLEPLLAQSGAVQLLQGVEKAEPVYVRIDNSILPSAMNSAVLKSVGKLLPPGVSPEMMPTDGKDGDGEDEFARVLMAYDLELSPSWGPVMVTPWKSLLGGAPKMIQKAYDDKTGQLVIHPKVVGWERKVLKAADEESPEEVEQFVLSAVLVPEVEDKQGEIYSHEEVRKACHWWAEHSKQFSFHHVLQGGAPCSENDVVNLENYVNPVTHKEFKEEILKGTWMIGSGIRNPAIWEAVEKGEVQSYSIGAQAMVFEEEA